MDTKLENLIEKIKTDGVEQANQMADEIIKKAQEESEQIKKNANKEGEKIIEKAAKEASELEKKSKLALERAMRDSQLLMKEKITELFNRVFKKEISRALNTEFLQKLIMQIVSKWDTKKRMEISVNESDKSDLENLLFAGLKEELKQTISIKVSNNITKGFRLKLENEDLYYDFSDETIAEFLGTFLDAKLKEILESKNG